jgi:hypothetical protein
MNATIARSIIREHIQDNIRTTLDRNINREASDTIEANVRSNVRYCVEENLWCTVASRSTRFSHSQIFLSLVRAL